MTYHTIIATDVTATAKAGRIKRSVSAAIISGDSTTTTSSPAVIALHPVAYITANMQSVLDEDDDYTNSDNSTTVSPCCPPLCAAVISNVKIPSSTVKQIEKKVGPVPFYEPHLWWHCSTQAGDFLPQTINTLIDPGPYTVLIKEDLVETLLLHHRHMHKPEMIELVMDSNRRKSKLCYEST